VFGANCARQIGGAKRLSDTASARFLSAVDDWLTTLQSAGRGGS
jgi:hypothetical protein